MKNNIFVFGSNKAGIHGKGSALEAKLNHGAKLGVGIGRTGNAYAIPTKDEKLKVLSLKDINNYVIYFIEYAKEYPELTFNVVRIGCGNAGFTDYQIAPMFIGSSVNCKLPNEWLNYVL